MSHTSTSSPAGARCVAPLRGFHLGPGARPERHCCSHGPRCCRDSSRGHHLLAPRPQRRGAPGAHAPAEAVAGVSAPESRPGPARACAAAGRSLVASRRPQARGRALHRSRGVAIGSADHARPWPGIGVWSHRAAGALNHYRLDRREAASPRTQRGDPTLQEVTTTGQRTHHSRVRGPGVPSHAS